jgi:hypothetical protein
MKVSQVSFAKSYAIVMNYNKISVEAGITIEVEDKETAQQAYEKARELVTEQLGQQIGIIAEELTALKK